MVKAIAMLGVAFICGCMWGLHSNSIEVGLVAGAITLGILWVLDSVPGSY